MLPGIKRTNVSEQLNDDRTKLNYDDNMRKTLRISVAVKYEILPAFVGG